MLLELEKQKSVTLQLVQDWSAARLTFRPTPAEWSANQVLDHVVRVESSIVSACARNAHQPHAITLRDRLGFLFIQRIMNSKMKVKTPPAAAHSLPADDVDLPSVCERWSATRLRLAQLLAEQSGNAAVGGVFRHPIAGWMSLSQTIAFLSAHLKHHGFQLAQLQAITQGM